MTIPKTLEVGSSPVLILTPAEQAQCAGQDVYLTNSGETNIYTGPANVTVAGIPIVPGGVLVINPATPLYAVTLTDATLLVQAAAQAAAPNDYTLVGGPYTPHALVGQPCSAIPTSQLLPIVQASPPPHVSLADGSIPADTTDPDVLGVRAYLHSSWGQVRLYEEGNLTIGDIG